MTVNAGSADFDAAFQSGTKKLPEASMQTGLGRKKIP
jgi:hypothetical protein